MIINFPKSFKIANNEIMVKVSDTNPDNDYGSWSDVRNTITIYTTIETEGESVKLSEEQLVNTFYHELFHCFQFYGGLENNEQMAQIFANFMREYESSKCN